MQINSKSIGDFVTNTDVQVEKNLIETLKYYYPEYSFITEESDDILGNENIIVINFNTTTFDFSKYQLRNTSYPKFTERQINWLFKRLNNTQISIKNRIDLRVEINSRLIKPFLILIISTLICFLLFTNNDKINLKKLKVIIYNISISLLIIKQIMLK